MYIRIKETLTLDDYPGCPLELEVGTEIDMLDGFAQRLVKEKRAEPADRTAAVEAGKRNPPHAYKRDKKASQNADD